MNRRAVLRAVGAGVTVGIAGCAESGDTSSGDAETSSSTQPSTSTASNTPSPETDTPEPTPDQSPASFTPTVSEVAGQYAHQGGNPQLSNFHSNLVGPQVPLGEVWSRSPNFGFPLLLRDNIVYILTPEQLIAANAATGTQQWAIEERTNPIAVTDTRLIERDGTIRTLSDGSIERQLNVDNVALVADNSIYATKEVEGADHIVRNGIQSASEQWRIEGYISTSSATLFDGDLLIYDSNGCRAVSQETGEERWNTSLEENTHVLLSAQEGIYVGLKGGTQNGSRSQYLYGIDVETGQNLWEKKLPYGNEIIYIRPSRLANLGSPYAVTSDEVVISGTKATRADDSEDFDVAPVVQTYALSDGSLQWSTELPVGIGGSLAAAGDRYEATNVIATSESIYVSLGIEQAGDGFTYRTLALDRDDGSIYLDHSGFGSIVTENAMFGLTQNEDYEIALWSEPSGS